MGPPGVLSPIMVEVLLDDYFPNYYNSAVLFDVTTVESPPTAFNSLNLTFLKSDGDSEDYLLLLAIELIAIDCLRYFILIPYDIFLLNCD
jgi:hypothetical protein